MLQWIVHIVIDALVLLAAANIMPKVKLEGFKTAIIVALIIGVLSFLLSWVLTLLLNVATFGIFYFLGLGFITRVIAYAIIIEIADQFSDDFKTEGFLPSLWLAVFIAIVGGIVDWVLF
ncbi:phage holin family protein [Salegentibacter salegens]|uniref:Putative membrane protein n=1 Tax=Salegentibacter salegens TaxID=143223 RepID=A0A1M7JZ14_9FLAO|nr:phage holin family protein [Salegentibacter salegens]PRX51985.1 putative membrane protein [Salegentibacter salegens]SHM57963.1 putative membrane protein [Salegentibacter salegens]